AFLHPRRRVSPGSRQCGIDVRTDPQILSAAMLLGGLALAGGGERFVRRNHPQDVAGAIPYRDRTVRARAHSSSCSIPPLASTARCFDGRTSTMHPSICHFARDSVTTALVLSASDINCLSSPAVQIRPRLMPSATKAPAWRSSGTNQTVSGNHVVRISIEAP